MNYSVCYFHHSMIISTHFQYIVFHQKLNVLSLKFYFEQQRFQIYIIRSLSFLYAKELSIPS